MDDPVSKRVLNSKVNGINVPRPMREFAKLVSADKESIRYDSREGWLHVNNNHPIIFKRSDGGVLEIDHKNRLAFDETFYGHSKAITDEIYRENRVPALLKDEKLKINMEAYHGKISLAQFHPRSGSFLFRTFGTRGKIVVIVAAVLGAGTSLYGFTHNYKTIKPSGKLELADTQDACPMKTDVFIESLINTVKAITDSDPVKAQLLQVNIQIQQES
jgi:hypothetical protein